MIDDLEQLLNKRSAAPQARTDLAAQIVQNALHNENRNNQTNDLLISVSLFNQIAAFFKQNILLPQPGIAFAVILLLGIWLGANYDSQTLFEDYSAEDVALSLIVDEGFNTQEWL